MSHGPEAPSRFARYRAKTRATDFDLALGARIRSARIAADVTLTTLGQAIGVTCQQIHKYEYGEDRVSAGTLQRIAHALGLHPGLFFDDCAGAEQLAPRSKRLPEAMRAGTKQDQCCPA